MQIIHTIPSCAPPGAGRPAFVPTMGNLHDGHLALVRQARRWRHVVASIFVNRLQFLPHEDFDSYPRTFDADCAKLRRRLRHLFAPARKTCTPSRRPSRSSPIRNWPTFWKGSSAPASSPACAPW
jgi:pantoate--beta-alanine ligase